MDPGRRRRDRSWTAATRLVCVWIDPGRRWAEVARQIADDAQQFVAEGTAKGGARRSVEGATQDGQWRAAHNGRQRVGRCSPATVCVEVWMEAMRRWDQRPSGLDWEPEGGRREISCGAEGLWDLRKAWGEAEAWANAEADSHERKKVGTSFCLHFILFRSRDKSIC
jgi:hypothetical protein